MEAIRGSDRAIPIKPVNEFLSRWQAVEAEIRMADRNFNLVIVGGRGGWG